MAASTASKFCNRIGSRRHLLIGASRFQKSPSAYCYGHFGTVNCSNQRNAFLRNTGAANNTACYHKLTSQSHTKPSSTFRSSTGIAGCRTVTFVQARHASDKQQPKVEVSKIVPIRNPLHLIKDGLYSMLIRFYFDPDFYLSEFAKGAKQAVIYVSQQISKGAFDEIDHLLHSVVLAATKETYNKMSAEERNNLAVMEEDMVSYPHDILVHYEATGDTKVIKVKIRLRCIWGYSAFSDSKDLSPEKRIQKIQHCDYEFHRDFSPGVSPEWIISAIEYSTLGKKL